MKVPTCILAAATLAACATTGPLKRQTALWQGRTGEELVAGWGRPDAKSMLSDGREAWEYARTSTVHTDGYLRDDSRPVTRLYSDRDGQVKEEVTVDTFQTWIPPETKQLTCNARFLIGAGNRIEQASLKGNGCAETISAP